MTGPLPEGYAVAQTLPPTLEDLRQSALAAWLWDGERGRIVWANRAGVAAFGGQSLFDLVDRPFDRAEPGVERIAELTRTLARGDSAAASLSFPSLGQASPFACRCHLHALADGRAGLLAVAEPAAAAPVLPADMLQAVFEQMALPAVLMARDGRFLGLNGEARALLGSKAEDFATLMGDAGAAGELTGRLSATATVSEVKAMATRVGRRDIRLTLQRLDETEAAPVLLLLDDITDRRQLERQMDVAPPVAAPPLPEREAQAFETLGRQLNHALVKTAGSETSPTPPAAPEPPPAPRRVVPAIPAFLVQAMDRVGDPTFIVANNEVVHVNQAGLAATGHDTVESAINDPALWQVMTSGEGPVAVSLRLASGTLLAGRLSATTVAWHGGPARQIRFLAGPAAAVTEPEAAKPAPAAQTAPPAAEAKAPTPSAAAQQTDPAPATLPEVIAPAPVAEVTAPAIMAEVAVPTATADDELRAILDTAADGIITLDGKGHIHTFSAGAEAIFGYRIAEVADRPLADFLTADSRKVLNAYLASLKGPGLASVFNDGREVTAVVRQGGEVPLFLTVGLLQSPRSLASFCVVVRDITQWKRTEAELRAARDRAEQVSRQKSDFLAHISHELRTPLNAIMGFSDAMKAERFGPLGNDKYRAYAQDIHVSGGHLLSLINDLLDLSKVEAGKLELNFTAVNLSEVAEHGLRMLQEPAAVARVVVRKSIAPGLPPVVADLRSMRQIMINLLSNALKFTEPGGQVIVSAELLASGELALRIKDTGIGMSASDVEAALEPFARVETGGRSREGTGLGLPLTKALTEANRARFAITSEPRKGTLVEITFPTTRVLAE
jgi:PAS domain S-box-containing protein